MKNKKPNGKKNHYSAVSWFNGDYWLLNGFLLPELAYSALCELVRSGCFHDLDSAIRMGIKVIIDENTALLVRGNRRWIDQLTHLERDFKENPAIAKPDNAGEENIRFLNQMYASMHKAENEN